MVILSPEDLNEINRRQALISFKRFELNEFEIAYNTVKAAIFRKNGLDPTKNYNVDQRGVVIPLDSPSTPETLNQSSADET